MGRNTRKIGESIGFLEVFGYPGLPGSSWVDLRIGVYAGRGSLTFRDNSRARVHP